MTEKNRFSRLSLFLSRPTRRPAHQCARLTTPPQCFFHVHSLKSLRLVVGFAVVSVITVVNLECGVKCTAEVLELSRLFSVTWDLSRQVR